MKHHLNNSYKWSSGHAIDFILAEFWMEKFDGGRWQRQHYFSFIFEIVAQFLDLVELLIFSVKREGRISLLLKMKLSHTGACMATCHFKISYNER